MRTLQVLVRSLLPPMLRRPIAGIACDQGGGAVYEASWAKIGPSSHHVPERTRRIAGLSGFFTLIQSREGPDLYGGLSRFDTIPSSPSLQACRNTVAPSASVCSLNTIPSGFRASSLASFALRSA
jgi:hypothetical protein